MKDSWFFDKNFNGLSDEIFDELQFFDFPLEDVETNPVEDDWSAQFQSIDEPCFDAFSVTPVGLCGKTKIENPQFGNGFSAAPVSILFLVLLNWSLYFNVFYLLNLLFSDEFRFCQQLYTLEVATS